MKAIYNTDIENLTKFLGTLELNTCQPSIVISSEYYENAAGETWS